VLLGSGWGPGVRVKEGAAGVLEAWQRRRMPPLALQGSGSGFGGSRFGSLYGGGGIQGRWIAAMVAAGTRGFTGLPEDAQRFAHLLFVPQALGIGGLLQLLPVAPHQVAQCQVAQCQIVAGPQPGVLQLQQ